MNQATATAENNLPATPQQAATRKSVRFNPNRVAATLDRLGLAFFTPLVRLAANDEPEKQLREFAANLFLPLIAFGLFLLLWSVAAERIRTDSMSIPTPTETWSAWQGIMAFSARENQKAVEFRERMDGLATRMEAGAAAETDAAKAADMRSRASDLRARKYSGPPTFFAQIRISLFTAGVGFLAASLVAVPLGIFCGLSRAFNTALNPLIQIFKPVSPLAWLPIVFVIVTALYTPAESGGLVTRALLISAGTVMLCSLWPTLINTAVGVAAVDQDHLNVAKVLRLNSWQLIIKIILPSALPLIFTGLRLSLGVGWMVLIAADMLAQNPGLGKFVWDTFQNGSSESMAQIVCAVFAIGIIGFFLDRIMLICQRMVTFDQAATH